MNKKLICLLLALMMLLCMSAAGMATVLCKNGHTWVPSSYAPAEETFCEVCREPCGYVHNPDNLEPGEPCPGCGITCGVDNPGNKHYFHTGETDCYCCGFVCVDHQWEIDQYYSDRYYCTVCNIRCQDEEGNTAHQLVMNEETGAAECSLCPFTCDHISDYGYSEFSLLDDGVSMQCDNCDMICEDHNYTLIDGEYLDYYACKICEYSCIHNGVFDENGNCVTCGSPHVHAYYGQQCDICGKICGHEKISDQGCEICGAAIDMSTYTISFNPGTAMEGTMPNETLLSGSHYQIPENAFPVPEGYIFTGWKISSDANGFVWEPGEVCEIISSDVTLTAQWKVPEMFTVRYDLEGCGNIEPQTVQEGTTIQLAFPENMNFPSGKEFDGWLVDGVVYDPGDEITVKSSITVKINWKIQTFTLTVYANVETVDEDEPLVIPGNKYGETIWMPISAEDIEEAGIPAPSENHEFVC